MSINKRYKRNSDIDVLILCGGYGSRLQPIISDRPKGMILIGGRPFLDILVDELLRNDFRRIIFCVGYLKEHIINHFKYRRDAEFIFSEETFPLGTGGAILNALPKIHSETLLILNGDSFCKFSFDKFIHFHYSMKSYVTLVLANRKERCDGGVVLLNESSVIHSFQEKKNDKNTINALISAGIYLLELDFLRSLKYMSPCSLEYDLMPKLVESKKCYGFVINSELVDIGTPERYLQASSLLFPNGCGDTNV